MSLEKYYKSRTATRKVEASSYKAVLVKSSEYVNIEDIKEPIIFEYRNNYDIHYLHRLVMSKFYYNSKSCDEIEQHIEKLRDSIITARSYNEMRNIHREIKKHEADILTKRNIEIVEEYKKKAESLLREYDEIPRPIVDLAGGSSSETYHPTEIDFRRIIIIENFLTLASQFIKINYICTGLDSYDPIDRCIECRSEIGDIPIMSTGYQICPHCGANNSTKAGCMTSSSGTNPNGIKENSRGYESSSNFIRYFHRWLGIEPPRTDYSLLKKDLDSYFKNDGTPIGEIMMDNVRDEYGHPKGTSYILLEKALKRSGNSTCYENMNYIAHHYWGYPLPDASHLENDLLSLYQSTQRGRGLMTTSEKGRCSNLPNPYVLYKLLRCLKFYWNFSHFRMPQHSSIQIYDITWKIMISRCGDPRIFYEDT